METSFPREEFSFLGFVMMDGPCRPSDVCLWECCVVTGGVAHRFPATSTKPLIRHLAFSLVLSYSLNFFYFF